MFFFGENYDKIICENKECCDISDENYKPTYLMSSDEMFERMPLDKKYDIIFIDGMHEASYLYRDIINSLKHLNKNGLILCHDVLPHAYINTLEFNGFHELGYGWTGDVWKVVEQLQKNNIEFYTVHNEDMGLGIIKYNDNPYRFNTIYENSSLKYEYVFGYNIINNANDWVLPNITNQGKYVLHLISKKDFLEMF